MKKAEITCRLTGKTGQAVRSHLIPRAFIKRFGSGPFIEFGSQSRFTKRRPDGWYDAKLVTREGEDLLAELDDYAAKSFFERGFTYRKRRNAAGFLTITGSHQPNTFVEVKGVDTAKLRRFGQSLLWRFAESDQEIAESVELKKSDLRRLKNIILGQRPGDQEYPVYFSIASDGNELPKMGPAIIEGHPFYRFFLDGVVCYVSPYRAHQDFHLYAPFFSGSSNTLIMWCFDANSGLHRSYSAELLEEMKARFENPFG